MVTTQHPAFADAYIVAIPQKIAVERDMTRFYKNTPCIHGHIGSWWVSGGACYECKRIKVKNRDSTKYVEAKKIYRAREDVRVKLAERQREDRRKNPEKYAVWDKTKYEKIKGTSKEKERQLQKQKRRYWSDPEKFKTYSRNRNTIPEVVERQREKAKEYKKNNPDVVRRLNLKHNHKDRAARKKRLPTWVSKEELVQITELYRTARQLKMHVDHIIPLQGKFVSGLHVMANLQLLTPSENLGKKNKFEVTP